jgi:two-component system sensor histidine kinase KdpD
VVERALLAQTATRAQVLEQSDRLKSALLSSVSHDFRSPLAAIEAAATSLQGEEVAWSDADRADFLTTIIEEAERLNHLVANLLDMSKIEAGILRSQRDWYPIEEVIGTVARRLRRRHGSPPLSVHLAEGLPLVPLDFLQIDRVLTNLIDNSQRYAPPGSPVQITAQVDGAVLEVCVENRGPHIAPEDLERIFHPFYRLSRGDRAQGAGLGLSICKGIVEAHGGRIWAENLAQGGVAFRFTLPLTLDGAGPPTISDSDAERDAVEDKLSWPEHISSS